VYASVCFAFFTIFRGYGAFILSVAGVLLASTCLSVGLLGFIPLSLGHDEAVVMVVSL